MTHAARTLITLLSILSIQGSTTLHGGSPVVIGEMAAKPLPEAPVAPAPYAAPVAIASAERLEAPSLVTEQQPTTGVVAYGATTEEQDRLDWAVARFDAAGLALPYVEVHFFDDREPCDGYQATFRQHQVPLRIDVCNANKMIIIHELAHAWDSANLDNGTREAFMSLRGLATWNSPTAAWKERGVEDLAEVVVWGLMVHRSGFGSDAAHKHEAFTLVTGVTPLHGETAVAAHQEPTADDYS